MGWRKIKPPSAIVNEALRELKRLKGKSDSRLIAGFGHMDEGMTAAVANPDTPDQWQNFGAFLADLREKLAGSATSVSIAASVTYKIPVIYVTD